MAGAVCAVHCLILGVVASLLPFASLGFFASPWVEGLFYGIAFLVGPSAWYFGYRVHKCWYPGAFMLAGLLLLVVSHFAGHDHGAGSSGNHAHGPWISVAAGACLVTFHLMNSRYTHRHGCNHAGCSHEH